MCGVRGLDPVDFWEAVRRGTGSEDALVDRPVGG